MFKSKNIHRPPSEPEVYASGFVYRTYIRDAPLDNKGIDIARKLAASRIGKSPEDTIRTDFVFLKSQAGYVPCYSVDILLTPQEVENLKVG